MGFMVIMDATIVNVEEVLVDRVAVGPRIQTRASGNRCSASTAEANRQFPLAVYVALGGSVEPNGWAAALLPADGSSSPPRHGSYRGDAVVVAMRGVRPTHGLSSKNGVARVTNHQGAGEGNAGRSE
jgi:hypothetical protein